MTFSKLRAAAIVLCVGFALGLTVFAASRLFLRSVLTADAVAAAEQLAAQLAAGRAVPPEALGSVIRYAFFSPDGELLESGGAAPASPAADPMRDGLRALAERPAGSVAVSHAPLWPSLLGLSEAAVQAVAVPVTAAGERLGTLSVAVDQSAAVSELTRLLSAIGIAIVSLAGIAAAILASLFARGRSGGSGRKRLEPGRLGRDPVTGLINREGFSQLLEDAVHRAGSADSAVALMIVDLSRFRAVNDAWGHRTGDKVLQLAAERLKPFAKPSCVARISDAGFALVLGNDINSHSVRQLAGRILAALSAPFEVEQASLALGANIGTALFPVNAENAEMLFRAADVALSKAKAEGSRGLRFFDTEMAKVMKRRAALERGLRHALERDEFVVFYQPQLDLLSGKLRGHEALVRWERPGEGIVAPNDFLPVAEDTGLIRPLGEWVLRRACTDAATWLDSGTVAVNFCRAQVIPDLDRLVAEILAEAGLPPDRLEIEVPESLFLEHSPDLMGTLLRVKELGVRVAMDDFGSGYSGLASLSRFPFDKIKIDRSFVSQITEDSGIAAILSSLIGLGRSLSVDITAEGVETQDQVTLLQAAGCSIVQGFLFGAPQRVHTEPDPHRKPMGVAV